MGNRNNLAQALLQPDSLTSGLYIHCRAGKAACSKHPGKFSESARKNTRVPEVLCLTGSHSPHYVRTLARLTISRVQSFFQ